MDAVLPQAVLAPAVAVVGAEDDRRAGKRGENRRDLAVDPFDARDLAAPRLDRVVVARERSARKRRLPRRASEQPRALLVEASDASRIEELIEIAGENASRLGLGIEPLYRAGTERAVALALESADDRTAFEREQRRRVTGMTLGIEPEHLRVLRVDVRLAPLRLARRESHEERSVCAEREMRRRPRTHKLAERAQVRRAGRDERVVAARVERDEQHVGLRHQTTSSAWICAWMPRSTNPRTSPLSG